MSADERVARGLAAQAARRERLIAGGAEPAGWKIGFNLPAVQRRLGLEAPVIGFLLGSGVVAPGATCPAGCMAEFEVAIHVGEDVPPDAGREQAGAAIAGLGPAIEVVTPPDLDLELEEILARNVFHRSVAFGDAVAGADLGGVEARMTVNGEERARCDALAATGDPAEIVRHVAALAGSCGARLRAGERIIAGAMPPVVPCAPGDRVELDLGALGRVALGFA